MYLNIHLLLTQIFICLLTLAHLDSYCNHFVCLSVASEPTNIDTLKILLADVKLYKDQK